MTPSFVVRRPRSGEERALAELQIECWRQTYAHLLPANYFEQDLITPRVGQWRDILANSDDLRVAVAEVPTGRVVAVGGSAASTAGGDRADGVTATETDQDGELIGFACAGPPLDDGAPRSWQLYSLYLHVDHHGCGAGQALLDAVVGTEPACLWVAEDNPRARAFYARNGFRPDGARSTESAGIVVVRLVR